MSCEILEYRYTNDWNLNSLVTDETFLSLLQPTFPLVVSNFSALHKESQARSWQDFLNGKKRGKPSDLRSLSEDSVVSYVAEKLNLHNAVVRTSAECASSLYALYTAMLISKEQNTPVVVFCGDNKNAEYDHWYFRSFGASDNSTGLPFDSSSKGFKMGTSCTLMLVKDSSVKTYGLEAKAIINKFHFYTDASNIANPGTISEIIKNLNIDYNSIDFWNSHATGTPVGDRAEYDFFKTTISKDIPIVSYKGYIGHCMGAAGSMEIIYSLEDKKSKLLRPNVILSEKIVDDPRIITDSTSFDFKRMLKVSLGFGGKTAIAEIDIL